MIQRRRFMVGAAATAAGMTGAAHAGDILDFIGGTDLPPSVALIQDADQTFQKFKKHFKVSDLFLKKTVGALVFPNIVRAGAVVGGSRGNGILIVRGKPEGFYKQQSASVGLQLGAQTYSQIYLFLQPEAVAAFMKHPDSWKLGVDGTIAVAYSGGQDAMDTAQLNKPVVVFTFDNAGLMLGLSLAATQIYPVVL